MKTGQDIQQDIRKRRSKVEADIRGHDNRVNKHERLIETIKGRREEILTALSHFYLPDTEDHETCSSFRRLNKTIQGLYSQKRERRDELLRMIQEAEERRKGIEKRTAAGQEEIKALGEKELEVMNGIKTLLEATPEYVTLASEVRKLEELLARQESQQEALEKEFSKKAKSFSKSVFFTYLLERGYGTPKYSGIKLVAYFDQKLADATHFLENRKNYLILTEVPAEGKILVENTRKALEAKSSELSIRTQGTERRSGLYDVRAEIATVEAQVLGANTARAESDKQIEFLLNQKKEIDTHQDPLTKEAKRQMKVFLQSENLSTLRNRANETPSKEDDHLVDQLEELEANLKKTIQETKQFINDRTVEEEKLKKIQKVERDFSNKNFDRRNSRFPDSYNVDDLLTGYILGSLSEGSLWREVESNNSTYSPPSYSGGSSYGGGSSDYSSGGGFSSSDFSSGGGFDSGGFSTGGDF